MKLSFTQPLLVVVVGWVLIDSGMCDSTQSVSAEVTVPLESLSWNRPIQPVSEHENSDARERAETPIERSTEGVRGIENIFVRIRDGRRSMRDGGATIIHLWP